METNFNFEAVLLLFGVFLPQKYSVDCITEDCSINSSDKFSLARLLIIELFSSNESFISGWLPVVRLIFLVVGGV